MSENNIDEGVAQEATPEAEMASDVPPEPEVEEHQDQPEADEDPAAFPRSYVERLRKENQSYRDKAKAADDLAARLHAELVRGTGRLADPSDLAFEREHLEDPASLNQAIEDLLASKPHLASRRPTGDIGQGATKTSTNVDLAALLRSRA